MNFSSHKVSALAVVVLLTGATVSSASELFVVARADATHLQNGQATPILVVVHLPEGGFGAGAMVRVSSGGGRFDSGGVDPDVGVFASGPADAAGRFVTSWRCEGPCSPGYLFLVEATLPGRERGTFPLWIEVAAGGSTAQTVPLMPIPGLLPGAPKPLPGFIPIEPKPVPGVIPIEPKPIPRVIPIEPRPAPPVLPGQAP